MANRVSPLLGIARRYMDRYMGDPWSVREIHCPYCPHTKNAVCLNGHFVRENCAEGPEYPFVADNYNCHNCGVYIGGRFICENCGYLVCGEYGCGTWISGHRDYCHAHETPEEE